MTCPTINLQGFFSTAAARRALGWLGGLAIVLGLALPAPAAPPAGGVPEYSVKASYLLLFTRYVEWPPEKFPSAKAPIIIGVLGTNPFGDVLQQTVRGQLSQNRPVEIRQVDTLEQAATCHVVFISRQDVRQQADWLARLRDLPVLTVVDTEEGLAQGAVIAFVMEPTAKGAKLRFDVSLPGTQRAGLRISSPMLVSARQIQRSAKEGG